MREEVSNKYPDTIVGIWEDNREDVFEMRLVPPSSSLPNGLGTTQFQKVKDFDIKMSLIEVIGLIPIN